MKVSFVAISDCPRARKPHNVAEDLILPAPEPLFRQRCAMRLRGESWYTAILWQNSSQGHKRDGPGRFHFHFLDEVRASWYLILSLNENTDVTDAAQLLVYIPSLDEEHFVEMTMFLVAGPFFSGRARSLSLRHTRCSFHPNIFLDALLNIFPARGLERIEGAEVFFLPINK